MLVTLTLRKTFAFTLLVLSVTTINVQAFTSPSFTDSDVDGIDDRVESFLGLSSETQDTDGDDIPDSLEFSALTTNADTMVNPMNDGDKDGISDFLEDYGFYVNGTTIRGLKRIVPAADWEAFKLRDPVGEPTTLSVDGDDVGVYYPQGLPVYAWAAEAIEDSGFISDSGDGTNKLLNISGSYQAIYNKFIAYGVPDTHNFLDGEPTDLGTIASIMAEFVSIYEPFLPTLDGKPLQVYYTDSELRSSDWDPYSDLEEALGIFSAGAPKAPANDPLIGAIPNITAHLQSYTLTEIKELRETEGATTNHTDVERTVKSRSRSHGLSVSRTDEVEVGTTISASSAVAVKQSNTWTFGSSTHTEDRDSFGTLEQNTEVSSLNCFAKLQLTLDIANVGCDKATAIQPKWYVTIGDTLWQTLNGSDYLGAGPTLAVGGSTQATVLGQGAGDAGCLTLNQANFIAQGGGIGIGTELESAEISYLDQDSGVIVSDGNWAVYKVNFEENLSRINLDVFTTENVEINKTFWVTTYDETRPNMRQSVRDVLEKAYTPVNCNDIDPEKSLCLATQSDGYILLGEDTALDFGFFDSEGEPLDYEDSYAAYQALAPTSGNPLDIYLPRRSSVSIVDISSRAPEFTHTEVISKSDTQTASQKLVIRATVFDYFGIDSVMFCKSTDDCYGMQAALTGQPEITNNGYFTLELNNYALQGTEYLKATNVVGKITTQSPRTFYFSLIESMYERVDKHYQYLEQINQWLSTLAYLQWSEDPLFTEISADNYVLMDDEATATDKYDLLSDLLGETTQACSYVNPQPLDDVESLLEQQQACNDALSTYEQGLADSDLRTYNPYKIPLKNNLVITDHGVSKIDSLPNNPALTCSLEPLDIITGMKLNYQSGLLVDKNIGIELKYRKIERTDRTAPEPLFKWSAVQTKQCGNLSGIDKQWTDKISSENGQSISALADFGWSVQGGDVSKLCVVYRDFDLTTASFSTDHFDSCSGTNAWTGIENFSNTNEHKVTGSEGPVVQSLNDVWLNAAYNSAQATYGRHYSYEYKYQPEPEHSLIDGQEYRFRANDDLFLTLKGIQTTSRSLALEPANGQDDQIWIIEIVNDREFRLRPKSFDGYLARPNDAGDAGDNIFVSATDENDDTTVNHNQHWIITHQDDYSYTITSVVNLHALSSEGLQLESDIGSDLTNVSWDIYPVVSASYITGSADNVTHDFVDVSFGQTFGARPVVFADMQTYNGGDTAGLRIKEVSTSQFKVMVEEEESRDTELDHTGESVSFYAVEPGDLVNASGEVIGESGSVTVSQEAAGDFHTLDFSHSYADPVVIMMMNSYNGGDPSHIRLNSVSADTNSVDFQIEEWSYLDGIHTEETVAYLVVEKGSHALANGQTLQALTTNTDHNWNSVDFYQVFESKPIVLSQSQTIKGGGAIVTRHDNMGLSSFDLRLQEEEIQGEHVRETIGVMAIGYK